MNALLGKTVALWSCEAQDDDGNEVKISGIFDIEEFQGYEPSAGIVNSYFSIARTNSDITHGETQWYTVDPDMLWQQADPKSYGQMLESEREMEFCLEMAER